MALTDPTLEVEDHSCNPRDYIDELSNTGRWGDDDVLGTLNFITPEIRVAAAATVREGMSIGCSFPLAAAAPLSQEGHFQRFMMMMPTDPDVVHGSLPGNRDMSRMRSIASIAETLMFSSHIQGTHLDSHNHVFFEGTTYNGISAKTVSGLGGAPVGDIALIPHGITTRGVLLDVAALLGCECLEAGYAVTPEELERAEERQGVRVQSGDIVLLRTGYGSKYLEALAKKKSPTEVFRTEGIAGWHPRCLPWLHERKAALIGHDGVQDPFPSRFGYSGVGAGLHVVAICRMGLWLMDWANLEELSRVCAELGRYEFLMTIAPPRFAGVSGFPVQPVALF